MWVLDLVSSSVFSAVHHSGDGAVVGRFRVAAGSAAAVHSGHFGAAHRGVARHSLRRCRVRRVRNPNRRLCPVSFRRAGSMFLDPTKKSIAYHNFALLL